MTITIQFTNGSSLICTNCRDLTNDGSWLKFKGNGPDGKFAEWNVNLSTVSFYSVIYP